MMETMVVYGIGRYDFEKDGQRLAGWKYHGLGYSTQPGFQGQCAMTFTLSDAKATAIQQRGDKLPQIGDSVGLIYNRFGRVGDIQLMDEH